MAVGITGTLDMGGTKFDVLSFSVAFQRNMDLKGRPSSIVMGGLMDMTIEITGESKLISQMINKNEGADGTIEFVKAGKDGVMRKVEFKNGYILSYAEGFQVADSSNFTCTLQMSAEKITVGNAMLDQRWPVES